MRSDRYVKVGTVLSEVFPARTVIVDYRSGAVAYLNKAAGYVWEAVQSPSTVEDVAAALQVQSEISAAQATTDSREALANLERRGLVTRLA
jgi:hypothetical protein